MPVLDGVHSESMRVNKKICRRCYSERTGGWTYSAEQLWCQDGYVLCGLCNGSRIAKVSEPVPEWCPYVAEQVVSQC